MYIDGSISPAPLAANAPLPYPKATGHDAGVALIQKAMRNLQEPRNSRSPFDDEISISKEYAAHLMQLLQQTAAIFATTPQNKRAETIWNAFAQEAAAYLDGLGLLPKTEPMLLMNSINWELDKPEAPSITEDKPPFVPRQNITSNWVSKLFGPAGERRAKATVKKPEVIAFCDAFDSFCGQAKLSVSEFGGIFRIGKNSTTGLINKLRKTGLVNPIFKTIHDDPDAFFKAVTDIQNKKGIETPLDSETKKALRETLKAMIDANLALQTNALAEKEQLKIRAMELYTIFTDFTKAQANASKSRQKIATVWQKMGRANATYVLVSNNILDLQNGHVRGLFTDIAKQPDIFFNALEEQFGYPIPQAERDEIVTAIHRAKNIEPQALVTDTEEAPAALDAAGEAIPHEDAAPIEDEQIKDTQAPSAEVVKELPLAAAAEINSDPASLDTVEAPPAVIVSADELILKGKGVSPASTQPTPNQKTECGEKVAAFFKVMGRLEKNYQITPATMTFALKSMNKKVDDAEPIDSALVRFRDEHVINSVLATIAHYPEEFLSALERSKRRTNGRFSIPADLKNDFQYTLTAAVYAVLEPQYQKFTDMVRPSHPTTEAIGPTLDVAAAR